MANNLWIIWILLIIVIAFLIVWWAKKKGHLKENKMQPMQNNPNQ